MNRNQQFQFDQPTKSYATLPLAPDHTNTQYGYLIYPLKIWALVIFSSTLVQLPLEYFCQDGAGHSVLVSAMFAL